MLNRRQTWEEYLAQEEYRFREDRILFGTRADRTLTLLRSALWIKNLLPTVPSVSGLFSCRRKQEYEEIADHLDDNLEINIENGPSYQKAK